MFNALN